MRRVAALLLLLALAPASFAREVGDRVRMDAKLPAWVLPVEPSPPGDEDVTESPDEALDEDGAGYRYLLLDRQVRVKGSVVEHFTREVVRVDSADGAADWTTLDVDWDPTAEKLILHRANVVRDGHARSRLSADALKVEDTNPDNVDVSYRQGASLPLGDVQAGDVLDFAWTIETADPAFAGRLADELGLSSSANVLRAHVRLVAPASRRLFTVEHGDVPPPVRTVRGDEVELEWEMTDVPARPDEDDVPEWVEDGPWVQVSEFASWREVARWGLRQLRIPDDPGSAVREAADRIRRENDTDERRLLAALRLAQDDVEYRGSDLAATAWRAAPPARTLADAQGDCKDKSALLVALLRQLGIAAEPAYASLRLGARVASQAPTPLAFDHVIVRAHLDGHAWWLDPTVSDQRGRLAALACPTVGLALPLEDGSSGLVPVTCGVDRSRIEVTATYALGRFADPVRLVVDTVYRGREADSVRGLIESSPPEELAREFRAYYGRWYPNLRSVGRPTFEDDPDSGTLRTHESYLLSDAWTDAGRAGRALLLEKPEIDVLLPEVDAEGRRLPFAVEHPQRIVHRTVVHGRPKIEKLPQADVKSAGIAAKVTSRSLPDGAVIVADYRTLADFVPAEALADHVRALRELRAAVRFPIRTQQDMPARPRWRNLTRAVLGWQGMLASAAVGLAFILARMRARGARPPLPPQGSG